MILMTNGDAAVLMSLPALKTLVLPVQHHEIQGVRDERSAQLLALWRIFCVAGLRAC